MALFIEDFSVKHDWCEGVMDSETQPYSDIQHGTAATINLSPVVTE